MKLVLNPNQELFFTSDSHYNHLNICKGTSEWAEGRGTRNFNTIEEMNEAIVNGINSRVKENDILIHVGDWSFNGIENIWNFRKQIKCKNIHLVLGNHDHLIRKNRHLPNCYRISSVELDIIDGVNDGSNIDVYAKDLFTSVNKYIELNVRRPKSDGTHNKYNFVIFHHPVSSWNGLGDGIIHIHGHVHLPPNLIINNCKSIDVGVDGNNFLPHSMDEIIALTKDQPINYLVLPKDHHTVI